MFENVYFYLFLVLLFFGIGDVLGTLTKAKLSSVFVSLFLFLICFVTGVIPPDIIKQAGIAEVGKWVTPFIVFSMGTSINIREFIAEWRTLVTAVFSMIVVAIAGLAMIPLIGYNETIVSVPIINGGIVATQIMTSAALEHGMTLAAALGAICYAVQKFVGTPIASYYGIREARILIEEYRRTGGAVAREAAAKRRMPRRRCPMPPPSPTSLNPTRSTTAPSFRLRSAASLPGSPSCSASGRGSPLRSGRSFSARSFPQRECFPRTS